MRAARDVTQAQGALPPDFEKTWDVRQLANFGSGSEALAAAGLLQLAEYSGAAAILQAAAKGKAVDPVRPSVTSCGKARDYQLNCWQFCSEVGNCMNHLVLTSCMLHCLQLFVHA